MRGSTTTPTIAPRA